MPVLWLSCSWTAELSPAPPGLPHVTTPSPPQHQRANAVAVDASFISPTTAVSWSPSWSPAASRDLSTIIQDARICSDKPWEALPKKRLCEILQVPYFGGLWNWKALTASTGQSHSELKHRWSLEPRHTGGWMAVKLGMGQSWAIPNPRYWLMGSNFNSGPHQKVTLFAKQTWPSRKSNLL